MLKHMGLKSMGIGGSFTFILQRWARGGKVCKDIHLGANHVSEGCKLGREVLFDGFHFCIYGRIHVLIDGGNIGNKFPNFLIGLYEGRG
jgi:hypothetical protein